MACEYISDTNSNTTAKLNTLFRLADQADITKDENGHRKSAEGVATTGSSEALMLGGLALKKTWQNKRKAAGKSFKEPGPNLVFGSNCQVVSSIHHFTNSSS